MRVDERHAKTMVLDALADVEVAPDVDVENPSARRYEPGCQEQYPSREKLVLVTPDLLISRAAMVHN